MDIIKYIIWGIVLLFLAYIFIRVFALGIAKSVIEAIQQSKQFNRKEKEENGIKKKTGDAGQVTKKNGTERKDKKG